MKSYENVQLSDLVLIDAISLIFANDPPAHPMSADGAVHIVF